MKTDVPDRVYVDGKLVQARRSNAGLAADECFPGPGGGNPRATRNGLTTHASESVWTFQDEILSRLNE